ncbi:MAG: hypothetical protein ACKV0T_29465 [Planctomycetales bacterium]
MAPRASHVTAAPPTRLAAMAPQWPAECVLERLVAVVFVLVFEDLPD